MIWVALARRPPCNNLFCVAPPLGLPAGKCKGQGAISYKIYLTPSRQQPVLPCVLYFIITFFSLLRIKYTYIQCKYTVIL
ncbi:Uncharacterized protein APZ42_008292 [Daphnia magna]|uniref:Uncharacterized protein n=1 Tax=Daphnia magna TaxID=35525 RepID=A0A164ERE0_9CRUS|nr:Uncharacterized protein APZ42_008292 [Daphnia magna]